MARCRIRVGSIKTLPTFGSTFTWVDPKLPSRDADHGAMHQRLGRHSAAGGAWSGTTAYGPREAL